MPSATYYLDQAKTNPLKVDWKIGWKNLTIMHNNQHVAEIKDMKELKEGKTFKLTNGQTLSVKLNIKWAINPELELLINGTPVPGSPADPLTQVKNAHTLLLFLAAFNIGLGLLAMLANIKILLELGVGMGTIIIGAIFLGLAFWGKQKNSAAAFMIAIGLLAADMVMTLGTVVESRTPPSSLTSAILVRIAFCLLLANGASAAKKITKSGNVLR